MALDDAEREENDFEADVTADDPQGKALYRAFADWAKAMFTSARGLTLTPEAVRLFSEEIAGAAEDNDAMRAVAQYPYVLPLLELHVARFGVDRTRTAAKRLLHLIDCLTDIELQPIAAAYFRSIAELYLMGFNNEAVILARGALDAVLESRLDDLRRGQPSRGIAERNLGERIRAASPPAGGILNQATFADAELMREAGNHAVHTQLGTQKIQALPAIRALYRILTYMYPQTPGASSASHE